MPITQCTITASELEPSHSWAAMRQLERHSWNGLGAYTVDPLSVGVRLLAGEWVSPGSVRVSVFVCVCLCVGVWG